MKNYAAVTQGELQSRSQGAQLVYLYAQRTKAASTVQRPGDGRLPVSIEQLKALIPGYEQLTDEEKLQLESALAIQSMINASLNQYIEEESEQQYAGLLLGQQQTLDSLDEQIRNASAGLYASSLEADKVKRLVQFYALQSCYELLLLRNEIRSAKLEADYLTQKHTDARQLKQAGLLTLAEVEGAKAQVDKQQKAVHDLELQYEFRLNMLKLDLGVDVSRSLVWQDESNFRLREDVRGMDVELDKQYDMRKADEAIHLAQADYERILKKDRELSNYYLISISIEKDKKTVTKRQLEKRLAELTEEGKLLTERLEDLKEDKLRFVEQRERYNTLLKYGQLTGREVEELEYQISKLDRSIHAAELHYEIWKEKKWAAIQGVLI